MKFGNEENQEEPEDEKGPLGCIPLVAMFLVAMLCSCVSFPVGDAGGKFIAVGGEHAFERSPSGHIKYVGSLTESLKDVSHDVADTAQMGLTGAFAFKNQREKEVTTRSADSNATKLGVVKEQEATKRAAGEIGAGTTKSGIDAGLFQKEGTAFKQP